MGIERVKVMSRSPRRAATASTASPTGINPATNKVAKIGDSVRHHRPSPSASPGTQLTHAHLPHRWCRQRRLQDARDSRSRERRREVPRLRLVETADGANIVLNKTAPSRSSTGDEKELETTTLWSARSSMSGDGEKSTRAPCSRKWDPYNIPVLSEKGGTLVFRT